MLDKFEDDVYTLHVMKNDKMIIHRILTVNKQFDGGQLMDRVLDGWEGNIDMQHEVPEE